MNYFYVYLSFTFIYLCGGQKAVDCELDVIWSNWSPCSKFCGGSGTQFRTRSIVVHPTNGGRPCGLTLQTQSCNTHECVCELSEWTNWSNCSAACGRGKQSRSRTIIRQPDPSLACGETYQERVCGNAVCPIDCELSSWGPWLSCSASCGPGLQSRYRRILTWPSNTGKACGQTKEQKVCQEKACPANCTLSTWSAWSKCNATCGTGEQFRIRTVLNLPHDGGKPCDLTKETKKCEAPIPCCEVSEWSSWSNCTKSCGVGALVRTRKLITKDSKCHGRFNIVETQKCNENPCPVDCLMGPWGEWSMCQEVCKGTQKRTRPVTRAPSNGGKKCLESYEIRNCSCPLQIDTSKEEVDTSHHFVGFAFGLVIGIVMSLSVLFVASYIRYQRKNSRPSVPYFSLGD